MLLSMYLMYRFARSGRSWSRLLDVGFFIVLISWVSASVPVTEFVILTFPASFLSFPFYFWSGELAAPAGLRDTFPWLPYHSIRFLTVNLNLTPDWALSGNGIATGPQFYSGAFAVAFLVLVLANVLGGVIGYMVGRWHELGVWSKERLTIIGIMTPVLAFVVSVFVAASFPSANWAVLEPVSTVMFGFGVIVVEGVFLSILVNYVEWPRVATLMVLSGLVFFLAGQSFSLLLMATVGATLAVVGGIGHFVKLVIGYVRAHEPYADVEGTVEKS